MKDARHITIAVVLGVMLLFVGALVSGIVFWNKGYNKAIARCEELKPDTITITKVDTVTLVENKVDTLIRIVNRLYPVAVHDTIVEDSVVYVELPYEHRYYALPDTLEVWYSGVDPRIDSARVYAYHTTEIIKQPYEVWRMPRLTADVGVTAFYSDNRVNPFLVGEVAYNAKHTTFSAFGAVNHEGKWGAGIGVTYRMNLIK